MASDFVAGPALCFALACNLDTVLLAAGYAARGLRVSPGHSLVLAAVNPMDISRASGRLVVPLDTAERIRVSRGLLPGRYIVRLRTANAALRLCLTEGGLARVSGQRQAVRQICSALQSLAGPCALPRAKPTCAQS